MCDAWEQAMVDARRFINRPGRESPGRLAGGLLEPLILNQLGRPEEAKTRLESFHNRIQDPWYRVISACLLDRIKEKSLAEKAGEQPAYLVTGLTALGLWAEGSDQTKQAFDTIKRPWDLIVTTGSSTSLPKNGASAYRQRPKIHPDKFQVQNFPESFRHRFKILSSIDYPSIINVIQTEHANLLAS